MNGIEQLAATSYRTGVAQLLRARGLRRRGKMSGSTINLPEPSLNSFLASCTPRLLSVLRIIAGFLFVEHGTHEVAVVSGSLAPKPTGLWLR